MSSSAGIVSTMKDTTINSTKGQGLVVIPDGARRILQRVAVQELLRQDISWLELIVDHYPEVCQHKQVFVLRDGKEEAMLPLHAILHLKPSIELVKKVYRAWPPAILVPSSSKSNVSCLGMACTFHASLEVTQFLYQQNKDAIRQTDANGLTPLHLACRYYQSFPVIEFLVRSNPQALLDRDAGKFTPIEIAAMYQKSLAVMELFLDQTPAEPTEALVLHVAAWSNTKEVIECLCRKYPWMLSSWHADMGVLPLHLACMRKDVSIDIVRVMLEHHRGALMEMDRHGRLPLTLAHTMNPMSAVTHFLREETVQPRQ